MLEKTRSRIVRFLTEEDGPTALEYMVMISIVVIFCLVAINTVGQVTKGSWQESSDKITDSMSP